LPPVLKTPADGAVISKTRPTFTWNASSGAVSYELHVFDPVTGVMVPGFPKTLTGTSYTIPSSAAPLSQSRPNGYAWMMYATDALGNQSAPDVVIWFTVFSGLTPTAGQSLSDSTPHFTWQGVSGTGADLWRLEIAYSPDMSDPVYVSPNLPATSTAFTLPNANALPAGVYYWRVSRISENVEGAQGRELTIFAP
jgi:hypothetical protein